MINISNSSMLHHHMTTLPCRLSELHPFIMLETYFAIIIQFCVKYLNIGSEIK